MRIVRRNASSTDGWSERASGVGARVPGPDLAAP
jgi:hypothetical protein